MRVNEKYWEPRRQMGMIQKPGAVWRVACRSLGDGSEGAGG